MNGRIFVCTTCDRYAPIPAGEPTPGKLLVQAMKRRAAEIGSAIAIRTVECLNACPKPCTAALRTPGKAIMRFSQLTPEDAPALLDAAGRYAESADGNLPAEALAPNLRGKLSGRVTLTRVAAPTVVARESSASCARQYPSWCLSDSPPPRRLRRRPSPQRGRERKQGTGLGAGTGGNAEEPEE